MRGRHNDKTKGLVMFEKLEQDEELKKFYREGTFLDDAVNKSALSAGLYDIVVDVKMTINWLNPPDTMLGEAEREHKQNILNHKAYEFKRELERLVKEAGK